MAFQRIRYPSPLTGSQTKLLPSSSKKTFTGQTYQTQNTVTRNQISARMCEVEDCIPPPVPTQLGFYVHSSIPKTRHVKPKYRSGGNKPKSTGDYYNIMWDPHIHRGDTFRTFQSVEIARYNAIRNHKPKKQPRRRLPPRILGGIELPVTPPLYGGRKTRVPTEKYLEEIAEVVEETDATTQTDIIEPKPPHPIYVVAKHGFDVATDLPICDVFNFDEEVEPVINTLADKVLEQSLLEVMEEEELVELRSEQIAFEDRRRIQALEQHLLNVRERALYEEQAKLVEKYIKEIKDEKELEDRVCTLQFSRTYLMSMIPKLLDTLECDGLITSTHLGDILEKIKPWLNQEVVGELEKQTLSRAMLDEILKGVVQTREAETAASRLKRPTLQNFDYRNYNAYPEYYEYEE